LRALLTANLIMQPHFVFVILISRCKTEVAFKLPSLKLQQLLQLLTLKQALLQKFKPQIQTIQQIKILNFMETSQ